MAIDHGGLDLPFDTTAAAVAQYTIVKGHGTADTVLNSTASSENLVGIAQEDVGAAGGKISVRIGGTSKVLLGGTVYLGTPLTSASGGKAVAASAGNRIVGHAMQGGVVNDVIECNVAQGSV